MRVNFSVLITPLLCLVLVACGGSSGTDTTAPPPVITDPPVDSDTDGDGVFDASDQCADTPANTQVDANGCPILVTANQEVALDGDRLVGGTDSANPGFTLYVFDPDQSAPGTSSCNGNCATSWPPLLVDDGVASGIDELTTITRNDGSLQVAYLGRPLYFYFSDPIAESTSGNGLGGQWWTATLGDSQIADYVPLYDAQTILEPAIQIETETALITRFSDRARDRHAKEDQFQKYDHYLSFYWEHRTAGIEIIDTVAKGGSTIRMNVTTEWRLSPTEAENRWWYEGFQTVAQYRDNGTMTVIDDLHYYKERSDNPKAGRPIQVGDLLEFEISQFLANDVPNGRANYYGTNFLYIVGEGIVPWETRGDFADPSSEREAAFKIPESAWMGGNTTLPYMYADEPDNHFLQMATNLSFDNGQKFVLGRRIHHTSFVDGSHDESVDNSRFSQMAGLAGNNFVNDRCASCHERNGGAAPPALNIPLDQYVVKVADSQGQPDANIGRVLQPISTGGASEGSVSIGSWTEFDGLRSPNYVFSQNQPSQFSARIAPRLVGLGLLEAIPETAILELADPDDVDGDGISGRVNLVTDPVTGDIRLGRFGWKATTSSIKHQVAAAFNTDMGVMTSVLPEPDCGSMQNGCDSAGAELADEHLNNLAKYIALLGVRPQRDYDDAEVLSGDAIFDQIGCADCHTSTFETSEFHPFAELRSQTIHPYSDMLLHDMGPGLADNLAEGEADGAEWRTTPLWSLGLSACVTGGVVSAGGQEGDEFCTPKHAYLHDGRARSIDEAIRWHGGEGQLSTDKYNNLTIQQRSDLLEFLNSL